MVPKRYIFIAMLAIGFSASAQQDPQAKTILDQVSAKNKSYKSISLSFTITETNIQNQDKTSHKGSLLLKGDRYVLKMPNSETYFDGKDVYNYLPDAKEVNISKPSSKDKKSDDFFVSNPKDLFRVYNKDFKSKFIKETIVDKKAVYEIDLYPIDLQKKYSRIRLQIDQTTSQIITIRSYQKDGHQFLITFDSFQTNKNIPDASFRFDTAGHPDVDVIDLRF